MPDAKPLQTAILGGGCFWCLEAVFQQLAGVKSVVSGYAGGANPNPTYKEVCGGQTGHAEVVKIDFEPDAISYEELLEVFFAIHDPTTLNRQGNDIGTQYRSTIMPLDDEQRAIAEATIQRLDQSGEFAGPIVTTIEPSAEFFPAEEYHQNYFIDNPRQPYCQAVVGPKVRKFQEKFAARIATGSADA